jgi:uncharacterized protein YndB with AHSA1/START domain
MFFPDSFKVSTPSAREIQVCRDFDAPRQLVFDAFTKSELVRRWLLSAGRPAHSPPAARSRHSAGLAARAKPRRRQWTVHPIGGPNTSSST